ncbi:heat shock protein 23-like [Haematobia irritans]|uniref:heat shock protein 23-like n=1 Tax=Haematobia irritans TaxID=7368 RepID=UPI003F4FF512
MANLPLLLSLANGLNPISLPMPPFYEAPLHHLAQSHCGAVARGNPPIHTHIQRLQSSGPVSTIGKDGFQVCMDVQQFKPSELSVKVLGDCIVVEGKHEEREDYHGYISRCLVRRFTLPKGYDPNSVVSTLSSDGVLIVRAPKPQIKEKSNERIIHIQQVGPAHLHVKENTKDHVEEDKKQESTAPKK